MIQIVPGGDRRGGAVRKGVASERRKTHEAQAWGTYSRYVSFQSHATVERETDHDLDQLGPMLAIMKGYARAVSYRSHPAHALSKYYIRRSKSCARSVPFR